MPEQQTSDLEVKDAQVIFSSLWQELEHELGRKNMRFPKEMILLGGAPGAGKGTNTDYIRKVRDIVAEPIVMSSLLNTPEMEALKAGGNMVGDREVVNILFREMLNSRYREGVVLDGFPRTKVQVEVIKMLYDAMIELRTEFANTKYAVHFKQPIYHIMILFVDEKESINRQMHRGREIIEHNKRVRESGKGELLEERPTDTDENLARNRYTIFKEKTYDALLSLKQFFHYHLIDAHPPLDEVKANILSEMEYQSSLELDPRTYDALSPLPLASDITTHARRDLVYRLDRYEIGNQDLFHKVIALIENKIMPIIKPHAISGRALINIEDALLSEPLALSMLIDIFSERGFFASVDVHLLEVPEHFDVTTGKIHCRHKKIYRINIRFKGSEIRIG
ncbi:nucleoside monophosphate kinase [Verrucomicrobiaceae bacterium N1E253]|uniref:Adenylate kinase n=2 Tax=Oceaniferula marina TaxID=2748318 RepID=A0A851GJC6_9BACT|nr:nucleoside monophosphate kinase [Oceaniferula marina]